MAQNDKYAFVAAKLREFREACGLTQTQVAGKLGKPQSYVAKIEIGERRIDVVELQEFAQLYGVKINEFIQGD